MQSFNIDFVHPAMVSRAQQFNDDLLNAELMREFLLDEYEGTHDGDEGSALSDMTYRERVRLWCAQRAYLLKEYATIEYACEQSENAHAQHEVETADPNGGMTAMEAAMQTSFLRLNRRAS